MTPKTPHLTWHTKVADLARSPLLDELTSSELAVLVRLLAAQREQGRTVRATNASLHRVPRTAQRALSELQRRKLVRIRRAVDRSRTIEVLA